MPELKVYDDKTLLFQDNPQNREKAIGVLSNLIHSLNFFTHSLSLPDANRTDAWTHMGLVEAAFKELTPYVDYDIIKAQQDDDRLAEVRTLNQKVRNLEAQIGADITPSSVGMSMRECESIIETYCRRLGFRHTPLTYTPWGITGEFYEDLHYPRNSTQKLNFVNAGFDIERDRYHANLLQTDKNVKMLQQMHSKLTPGARVTNFKSRKTDDGNWALQHTVYWSWQNVQDMQKPITTYHVVTGLEVGF